MSARRIESITPRAAELADFKHILTHASNLPRTVKCAKKNILRKNTSSDRCFPDCELQSSKLVPLDDDILDFYLKELGLDKHVIDFLKKATERERGVEPFPFAKNCPDVPIQLSIPVENERDVTLESDSLRAVNNMHLFGEASSNRWSMLKRFRSTKLDLCPTQFIPTLRDGLDWEDDFTIARGPPAVEEPFRPVPAAILNSIERFAPAGSSGRPEHEAKIMARRQIWADGNTDSGNDFSDFFAETAKCIAIATTPALRAHHGTIQVCV